MESIIKVGQRFKFTVLTDDAPSERQAVVVQVLSNREKGLGLDVDDYMSYWIEARELRETESSTILVFVRSTDGKVYLDGKLTDVTVLPRVRPRSLRYFRYSSRSEASGPSRCRRRTAGNEKIFSNMVCTSLAEVTPCPGPQIMWPS
jgi:hypothetical protein